MIIRVVQISPDMWHATLRGDSTGVTGLGETEREAVGDLIYQWAAANDATAATRNIDVAIEGVSCT